MTGEEDAAWFTLLALNERANAVAVHFLHKSYIFKATCKAFRKWVKISQYYPNKLNTSSSVNPSMSGFEKRRLELLEMAAAVTAATAGMTSRSFDGILRSRPDNNNEAGVSCN